MACTDPVSNPPTTTAAPFVSKAKNSRGSSSFNDCFLTSAEDLGTKRKGNKLAVP